MHILLTGGGTGGHVVPNLAIADALTARSKEVKFSYLGSKNGPEKALLERAGIPFESLATGKLRRYFDWRNFTDPFKILFGFVQAWVKLFRLKPDVLFSKGGFVAVPVVWAAALHRIPILIHESDARPGLATRLSAPFAKHIFLGFEEAKNGLERWTHKIEVVGNPVRPEILKGQAERAKQLTGFDGIRPVLLVMGGSSGSQEINEGLAQQKKALCEHWDIIHITGEGKGTTQKEPAYYAQPYAHEELKDLYALASLALTRAGANSLAELEALGLPALLLPLGLAASRGDQVWNAKALVARSPQFKVAEPGALWTPQLLALPPRKATTTSTCTERLATAILEA
jgi:UDP-N-acetylglucosamine--N-acetylmuramyl-(pentapeptide) pyrophosphoryl-undecaprenol N-acetylglucosamine transferase